MERKTVVPRIDKEQYLNLGVLAKEYGLTRTQILNDLVHNEYRKFLKETANDLTV